MKLTQEIISQIEEAFAKLDPSLEITADHLEIGNDTITVDFPRDDLNFAVEEIIKYIASFGKLQCAVEKVSSDTITQMPVYSIDKPLEYVLEETKLRFTGTEYEVRIVENPVLIGIAAVQLDIYDKYHPPCSSYIAVEIRYFKPEYKLDEQDEFKTLKSFLFEYSRIAGAAIDFTSIHELGVYDDVDISGKQDIQMQTLPAFSEGMDLYRKALAASDEEISFLYFYKLIEYYSPIAAKLNSYETLSKKISTIKYKDPTNEDLSAIFSISEKYRISLSDRELAQTLLETAIDIVDIFPRLPDSIKKRIKKNIHLNQTEVDYSTKTETLQSIIKQVGNILYSTRNSIVHAKSNYRTDDNECKSEDLQSLNKFLEKACSSIIDWHTKLPAHLRVPE